MSQKSVKEIKTVQEFGRYEKEFKYAEAAHQQMSTNIKTSSVEISNMNKDDDEENELMKQSAYIRLMATKNHEEIKRLRLYKTLYKIILYNKYNMSDKELKIPRTDSVEQYKTDKFLDLEDELPKFDPENQEYMKMIKKLCCIEKDIRIKRQENEEENSKSQKIKHEEYESDIHIMLLNRIMELYTEIEWWQQRFQKNKNKLMAVMIERQKREIELMKLATKVTKLQNLCNSYEKKKINLLLQLKNKNKTSGTESFNASTLQKSSLQEESQQTLEINNLSSNLQDTLKKQVAGKQVPKDSDYISSPIICRQEMMESRDYNHITLPTTNITNTETDTAMENQVVPTLTKDLNKSNKADESPEQVDKDSLTELLINEEKMNKMLNNETKAIKLLEDMKTNDESIIIKGQIRGEDKVTDAKTENERDDTIFTKKLIFPLPCYESLHSNTTKDQKIIKNITDKAYQPPDDYHSLEYSYKKSNDACTSQQRDKNQLGVSDANTHIRNRIKCTYRNLTEHILKLKYYGMNDHVNNNCQTTTNNKNKEHGYTLNETVEEDQVIKVVEENEIKEIENTDPTSNETLLYVKDVTLENNGKMTNGTLMVEDISNVAHKIDKKIDVRKNWWTMYIENMFSRLLFLFFLLLLFLLFCDCE